MDGKNLVGSGHNSWPLLCPHALRGSKFVLSLAMLVGCKQGAQKTGDMDLSCHLHLTAIEEILQKTESCSKKKLGLGVCPEHNVFALLWESLDIKHRKCFRNCPPSKPNEWRLWECQCQN